MKKVWNFLFSIILFAFVLVESQKWSNGELYKNIIVFGIAIIFVFLLNLMDKHISFSINQKEINEPIKIMISFVLSLLMLTVLSELIMFLSRNSIKIDSMLETIAYSLASFVFTAIGAVLIGILTVTVACVSLSLLFVIYVGITETSKKIKNKDYYDKKNGFFVKDGKVLVVKQLKNGEIKLQIPWFKNRN